MFNYVYLTINKINGKGYIGSHISKRENDTYIGSGNYFLKSVKKYGKENFLKIKLKNFETILEARKAEEHYIKLFNTLNPDGYNMSPTGGMERGVFGKHSKESILKIKESKQNISKETRDKISKFRKGKEPYNKGIKGIIKFSNEINKKKGRSGELNAFYNKNHSLETILKMSNLKKGEKNPMYGKKGTMFGKKHSLETILKMQISHIKNSLINNLN